MRCEAKIVDVGDDGLSEIRQFELVVQNSQRTFRLHRLYNLAEMAGKKICNRAGGYVLRQVSSRSALLQNLLWWGTPGVSIP